MAGSIISFSISWTSNFKGDAAWMMNVKGTFAFSKISSKGCCEVKSATIAKLALPFHSGCVLRMSSTLSCDRTVAVTVNPRCPESQSAEFFSFTGIPYRGGVPRSVLIGYKRQRSRLRQSVEHAGRGLGWSRGGLPFFFARVAILNLKQKNKKTPKPTIGRPFCFIYHHGYAFTYKLYSNMRS